MVGDPDQLRPIQAGSPVRYIAQNVGAARLTDIRRRSSDWQSLASQNLAMGRVEQALQSYADHGNVQNSEDRDQAITALVDDSVADMNRKGPAISRLDLAHRRKDVYAINQGIRAARQASETTKEETLFSTEHGLRAFAQGDRILFACNYHGLGVRNGILGTVTSVGGGQLKVVLDSENARPRRGLTFSPKEYSSIDHGFAVSIHRSQSCTVDCSFVLSSQTLDKHLTYVALTRHKEVTSFYASRDIAPKRVSMPIEFRNRARSRTR